jgi:alpha-tubulin suppressor-like RCC1 family protein
VVPRGLNDYGQLGLGDPGTYGTHLSVPHLIVNLAGVPAQSVSGGQSHSVFCTDAQVPAGLTLCASFLMHLFD